MMRTATKQKKANDHDDGGGQGDNDDDHDHHHSDHDDSLIQMIEDGMQMEEEEQADHDNDDDGAMMMMEEVEEEEVAANQAHDDEDGGNGEEVVTMLMACFWVGGIGFSIGDRYLKDFLQGDHFLAKLAVSATSDDGFIIDSDCTDPNTTTITMMMKEGAANTMAHLGGFVDLVAFERQLTAQILQSLYLYSFACLHNKMGTRI